MQQQTCQGRHKSKYLCFFLGKKSYFDNGRLQSRFSFNLISVTHYIEGFHVQICHRGSPGGKIQQYVSFWTLSESLNWRVTPIYGATLKNLTLGFSPNFGSPYTCWEVRKNILGPKVNVKFFKVDPYTPCNRVSRPFPIWQIWSLLGQKTYFLVVSSKGEIKYG